jgi:hypothetical protein
MRTTCRSVPHPTGARSWAPAAGVAAACLGIGRRGRRVRRNTCVAQRVDALTRRTTNQGRSARPAQSAIRQACPDGQRADVPASTVRVGGADRGAVRRPIFQRNAGGIRGTHAVRRALQRAATGGPGNADVLLLFWDAQSGQALRVQGTRSAHGLGCCRFALACRATGEGPAIPAQPTIGHTGADRLRAYVAVAAVSGAITMRQAVLAAIGEVPARALRAGVLGAALARAVASQPRHGSSGPRFAKTHASGARLVPPALTADGHAAPVPTGRDSDDEEDGDDAIVRRN